MSARKPITNSRPPSFVSRETGAAELDFSVDTWDAMVREGKLPPPAIRGLWWWWPDVGRAVLPGSEWEPVGYIYFVGFDGYVKIGYTASHLNTRLIGIQVGAPERLRVYAVESGGRDREKELHRQFGNLRTMGEWFRRAGALADHIDALVDAAR